MLRNRHAIVIGPTPPGTGVIAPATAHRVKIDVADKAVAAARQSDRVDADIDYRGARLDPVDLDHLRLPNRCYHNVGPPADRGRVAALRVDRRDSAIRRKEKRRHRLSDEVRAAEDDRLGAGEIVVHRAQQDQTTLRGTGYKTREAGPQPPDIDRVKAVDVLGGVDGSNDAVGYRCVSAAAVGPARRRLCLRR